MTKRTRDNDQAPFLHRDHPRPVTRRQFLGQGFLAGAAFVTIPSLLQFLSPARARAQAVCGVGVLSQPKIPAIVFDLGGGASTCGSNVLVGGPGGQLDFLDVGGYERLGIPATQLPSMDPLNVHRIDSVTAGGAGTGLAFHADSAFLRGIQFRANATTLANVNGAVFCARSDNDTGNNPHNPMFGFAEADRVGQIVTLIGTRNADSGGRSMVSASMYDPEIRPTKVSRPEDATGLVDTGKLVTLMDPTDAASVMQAAKDISTRKMEKLSEGAAIDGLVDKAFNETIGLTAFGPDSLDPVQDACLVSNNILDDAPFNTADMNRSEYEKTAAVAKLVVENRAGCGTIEFGGYDYHDSTRATGEIKDFRAGECIGAALEYAAKVGTPLAVYVLTDGSVASDGTIDGSTDGRDKLIWKGDNSGTAGTFMLVYDPLGQPPVLNHQIGYFRASGAVETSASPIADNVTGLAQAIVLNYLALHGEEGRFGNDVVPGTNLVGQMAALTAFGQTPSTVGP
jgi:hypothetical protein